MKRMEFFKYAGLGAFLLLITTAAASAEGTCGENQQKDFGSRLKIKQYAGMGIYFPKEGDIGNGLSLIYGARRINKTHREATFLDFTYTRGSLSNSVLWTTGHVRQIVARFGYKWEIRSHERWWFGLDVQSHRMDFGSRRVSGGTYGAMLEYKMAERWSAQFDSSQKTDRGGIGIGGFHLIFLCDL